MVKEGLNSIDSQLHTISLLTPPPSFCHMALRRHVGNTPTPAANDTVPLVKVISFSLSLSLSSRGKITVVVLDEHTYIGLVV